MDHQPTQEAIQEHLKELSSVTVAIGEQVHKQPANAINLSNVLEYINAIKKIHGRIADVFKQEDRSSESIEQFFNRWNNLLLGVCFVEGLIRKNNCLTEKQHEIFILSLEEINDFAKKFSIARQ